MIVTQKGTPISAPMFSSAVQRVVPVTLPAAPWEAGYDLHAARAARKAAEAEREAVAAKFRAIGASRKSGATCAKPGCEARLTEGNTTGLCRSHTHAIGLCGCSGCQSGATSKRGRK